MVFGHKKHQEIEVPGVWGMVSGDMESFQDVWGSFGEHFEDVFGTFWPFDDAFLEEPALIGCVCALGGGCIRSQAPRRRGERRGGCLEDSVDSVYYLLLNV